MDTARKFLTEDQMNTIREIAKEFVENEDFDPRAMAEKFSNAGVDCNRTNICTLAAACVAYSAGTPKETRGRAMALGLVMLADAFVQVGLMNDEEGGDVTDEQRGTIH